MRGRALIIAGSDSGGGAGIQADIKTVTALGGYAMTAITALTAQNTRGVHDVKSAPPDFIAKQIEVTASDLGVDAVKTGMLANAEIIDEVAKALDLYAKDAPAVIDPVMVAKGGASLLEDRAIDAVKAQLIPRAAVITPNAPEAQRLTGLTVATLDDQKRAGEALLEAGAGAALIKGGHLEGEMVQDVLVTPEAIGVFEAPRQDTRNTHGTGCTLASAIAVRLAQGMDLSEAVREARDYVWKAIATAPGYGGGAGPLNHAWPCAEG